MFDFKLTICAPLAILFGMTTAQAAVIEWTLQDFTFQDGGTATGSFLFDTDTFTPSNINITTSGGSYPFSGLYTMSPIGSAFFLERNVAGGVSRLSLGGVRVGSLSASGTTLEIGPILNVSSNGEDFTPTGSANATISRTFTQSQPRVNGFLTSQLIDTGGGSTGGGSTGGGSTGGGSTGGGSTGGGSAGGGSTGGGGMTGGGTPPAPAPVPLPAGVWFLVAALGGLGLLRQGQSA